MSTLSQILETDTLSQTLQRQRELIFAVQGEELGETALKMAKNQVSAVPVFSDPDKTSCMGLLDFPDIVCALLAKCESDQEMMQNRDKFWFVLSQIKVDSALNASGKNPMSELPLTATLKQATEVFAELGAKRVLVVDANRLVLGLLSPSALTTHAVARLKGILDPTLTQTVDQLSMGTGPVIYVTKARPFIEAMILMRESKLSCLAVVDASTGVLAGSISMSDIKMLFATEDFTLLTMSCWDFIVLSRSLQDSEQFPFFGVGPDSKVLSVVSKLLATAVHHIYVVDSASKPKKVISFSDVCRALLN